jgi:acyl carrier protein
MNPPAFSDPVVAQVFAILREITGCDPVCDLTDIDIHDLGMDSLSVFQLGNRLEESFGIKIPDHDLLRLNTLGQITAYIRERLVKSISSSSSLTV